MSFREWISPKTLIFAAMSVGVVLLDQYTKSLVLKHFQPGESIPLISGFLNLTFVKNTGAAFGMLATSDPAFRGPFFIAVPAIALIAIAWVFRKLPHLEPGLPGALGLVAGGAVGNLIDRMQLGYVIDFFDFHWHYEAHFAAFNIADSGITLGVAWMLLDLIFESKEPKESHAPHSP